MYHIKSEPIEDLLPWSDKIPEEIRIHKEDLEKRKKKNFLPDQRHAKVFGLKNKAHEFSQSSYGN